MATSPAPEQTREPQKRSLFEWISENRTASAYTLLAIGFILALFPLWIGLKYRGEYAFLVCMTALLPLAPVAAGLWRLVQDPQERLDLSLARMLVLAVGGLTGFAAVLVAASLAYGWWDTIVGGTKEWQGPEGWKVWVAIVVLVAGLALIFASLQLGRSEERSNYLLRRLLYGYNAVLTGILLLTILAVVNILVSIYWKDSYDWTTQSLYALSSRSENILQGLAKPTKIYVILPKGGDLYRRVQALLDNCRGVNDKLEVTYYSPDLERDKVKDLARDYQFTGERGGLLVVYGTPPNAEHQFINQEALSGASESSLGQNREIRVFKGESELMAALSFLENGKQKPVLYFTQGDGELDLSDFSGTAIGVGAGQLKQKLEQENFTVRGLQLASISGLKAKSPDVVIATEVPDDASTVVVAGPKRMSASAVDALRKYMQRSGPSKKKGRLVVLLDPLENGDGEIAPLQQLLGEFNVQAPNGRVLAGGDRLMQDPRMIMVLANPAEDVRKRNAVANAFDVPFYFYDTRTVENKPPAGAPPMGNRYRVDELMLAPGGQLPWVEKDLKTPPRDFLRRERIEELRRKITGEPFPVAAAVSETSGGGFHQATQEEDRPCMVVFGTSSFISNGLLTVPGRRLGPAYDLFVSTLGWLGERRADIGIEPKKPDTFEVNVGELDGRRLFLLPAGLMLLGVVGLGTGVWVVRRR